MVWKVVTDISCIPIALPKVATGSDQLAVAVWKIATDVSCIAIALPKVATDFGRLAVAV